MATGLFSLKFSETWIKKSPAGQGFFENLKNQAAFFLPFDFFFLPAFLAALGASAAGLLAGAAAGAAAGVAGAAAGAAGTTGAVGAAVCATETNAKVLRAPATMILYMKLPSKNRTRQGYNDSVSVLDDINQY